MHVISAPPTVSATSSQPYSIMLTASSPLNPCCCPAALLHHASTQHTRTQIHKTLACCILPPAHTHSYTASHMPSCTPPITTCHQPPPCSPCCIVVAALAPSPLLPCPCLPWTHTPWPRNTLPALPTSPVALPLSVGRPYTTPSHGALSPSPDTRDPTSLCLATPPFGERASASSTHTLLLVVLLHVMPACYAVPCHACTLHCPFSLHAHQSCMHAIIITTCCRMLTTKPSSWWVLQHQPNNNKITREKATWWTVRLS